MNVQVMQDKIMQGIMNIKTYC